MADNMTVAYSVLGVYLLLIGGCGVLGAFLNFRNTRKPQPEHNGGLVQEHFMAGLGLGAITWFFSMAATLFSGYSVSGIVNEAYRDGWIATRWIPGGVGVYVGFMVLAPRCYALGKQRGYMTISELIFDRYLPTSSNRPWVAHALRLLSFAFLQLPVFTYLITQFRSVGAETEVFTDGGIDSLTAVLVCAGLLLICDIMGGLRAVAYSDVVQGVVLFVGSIIFLVIQQTELGGMREAFDYWANPANLGKPRVNNMQLLPTQTSVVSYFDFVFRTTVAATMFPHLCQRLFAARSSQIMRRGLAAMTFTFFIVQLSSMITGWVAINALIGKIIPGKSAFGTTLLVVAREGTGQAFCSAMLLAAAICAMMSTADSALLAFSTMWVRDLLKPYIWKNAPEWAQLVFGKIMAMIGLAIGVLLALLTIKTGTPDLSGLFSLQTVTPIHVAPAVWLGLHWRGLRGEAVLAGMVSGSAVTLGLVFSDKNVKYAVGDDMLENGLSSSWVGFCVNIFVTVTLGLALQYLPILNRSRRAITTETATTAGAPAIDASSSDASAGEAHPRHLDIGPKKDPMLHPAVCALIFLLLLFSVPFYWGTYNSPGYQKPLEYVGTMAAWAFTSLFIAGLLATAAATAYIFIWRDYEPLPWALLPSFSRRSSEMTSPVKSPVSEEGLDKDVATKTAVM